MYDIWGFGGLTKEKKASNFDSDLMRGHVCTADPRARVRGSWAHWQQSARPFNDESSRDPLPLKSLKEPL